MQIMCLHHARKCQATVNLHSSLAQSSYLWLQPADIVPNTFSVMSAVKTVINNELKAHNSKKNFYTEYVKA
jgi:hypothetical protein